MKSAILIDKELIDPINSKCKAYGMLEKLIKG